MSDKQYPPTVHHKTVYLQPADAAKSLAAYLQKSRKCAHLHPDAWLDPTGIRFGPKSGPNGGWAIHHLRRIEAGLRGESLAVESRDDLAAQLGEEVLKEQDPDAIHVERTTVGDDTRVDGVIAETLHNNEDEKTRKKREKKERAKREKAEREGASTSAGGESSKKRKRNAMDSDVESRAPGTGANTPYADSTTAHSETWQTRQEYEQDQDMIEGEVGERGAPGAKQGGPPPTIVQHDQQDDAAVPQKALTAEEKAERKRVKKARRAEEVAAASAAGQKPVANSGRQFSSLTTAREIGPKVTSVAKKQFSAADPALEPFDKGDACERQKKRYFTQEEDESIVRLRNNGVTFKMIAAQLERRTKSVENRYYDALITNPLGRGVGSSKPKHFFTTAEDRHIIEWRDSGVGWKEIGDRLGRETYAVICRYHRFLDDSRGTQL